VQTDRRMTDSEYTSTEPSTAGENSEIERKRVEAPSRRFARSVPGGTETPLAED